MMAAKIKREVGIETMPHIACRDRNRIALKSAFLAAHIERVNTFLVVTGDAIRQPPIPKEGVGEKAVYSFDSTRLLSYIQSLNEEVFVSEPIRCAAALNVNARRFDVELERAVKKEEAGASFFLTQAIFSAEAVDNLKKAHETLESPILAGILPLAGYKNAVFLNNEVGGIDIPDRIVESLKDKSTEEMKEISLAYCRELIGMTKDFCSGYYLMMPLKRLDLVSELLEYIKKEVT